MSYSFIGRRQLSIEALEQRRLLAADLKMASAGVGNASAETVVASSPVAVDLKGVRNEAADFNRLDNPAAQDQLFEQIGAADLRTVSVRRTAS